MGGVELAIKARESKQESIKLHCLTFCNNNTYRSILWAGIAEYGLPHIAAVTIIKSLPSGLHLIA
jgi:hypothetical protein